MDGSLLNDTYYCRDLGMALSLAIGCLLLQQSYFILTSTTSIEYGILLNSNPFFEGKRQSEVNQFEAWVESADNIRDRK